MKAKSYLVVISYERNIREFSIKESADYMIEVLLSLGSKFEVFKYPIYYHSNKKIELNLNDDKESLSNMVATQILNKEWNEITKIEGARNPTIDYRRGIGSGFSGWFSYVNESENLFFDCSIGVGYNTNGVVISPKNKEILFDYSWYEKVLRELIICMRAHYCTVRVSIPSINEVYKKYNFDYPLGWLTYYSNELQVDFSDLQDICIEPYLEGTIVKTDEIDFLADKDSFDAYKERLNLILGKIYEKDLRNKVYRRNITVSSS